MLDDAPSLVIEDSWVGVYVDALELMEKAEESSALESVEVLDEGGVHQNENNIEENRSRKDADLQEDYNTEHQRVSGESPEEFTSQVVQFLSSIYFLL